MVGRGVGTISITEPIDIVYGFQLQPLRLN